MKFSEEVLQNLRENTYYDHPQEVPREDLCYYLRDLKHDQELVKDIDPDHYKQDIREISAYLWRIN